jgi:TolB protein
VNVYGDLPVNMQPVPTLQEIEIDAEDNLTRVTYSPVGGDFDPHMSPNGKFLVYSSTQHRPTSDIYVKSIEGRSVTQLTADPAQDIMPVFSPDGQRIAFASDRSGSWDIYVMSIAGGQPLQVTSDASHELHATWSPDGSMLAYSRLSTQTGRWELWVADMNNAGVRKFIGYGLFPEWSPNPAVPKISFQRARERDSRLFSIWTIDFIDGEGVNATEVASSANAALINPTWSPDASHIVFAATVDSADDGTSDMPEIADLWMIEHDGSNRVNLTDGRFACLMPTWGADGKIYFVANREGVDNIWSIGPTRGLLASASMTFDETTVTATASVPEDAVVGQE